MRIQKSPKVHLYLAGEQEFNSITRCIKPTRQRNRNQTWLMRFFVELIHDREDIHKKLDDHEIAKDEYEERKRTWDKSI